MSSMTGENVLHSIPTAKYVVSPTTGKNVQINNLTNINLRFQRRGERKIKRCTYPTTKRKHLIGGILGGLKIEIEVLSTSTKRCS